MHATVPLVKSLREFVRDVLLERIARNELVPGQRIVEATLVKEFSISATPVREAIRELVAMEVLEAQNNKGASVREVRLDEVIEAFAVRAALEALAARPAAARLQGDVQVLRRAAESIVKAARQGDFAKFQEHNQVFHRTIVQAADNRVLLKVWDSLFFQVRTRFTMDYLTHEDPVAIALEHVPIADALDRGNADLAAALLASHSDHLVEFLKKEQRQQLAAHSEKPRTRRGPLAGSSARQKYQTQRRK
jgi:DNA-binding GntR family transcriptional regulator